MKTWVQELERMRKTTTTVGKDPEVTPDFSWMRDQFHPIANPYDGPISQLISTSDTDMLAAEYQKEFSENIVEPLANPYARSDKDDGDEELVTASGSTRSGESTSPRPTPPPASPRPPPRLNERPLLPS